MNLPYLLYRHCEKYVQRNTLHSDTSNNDKRRYKGSLRDARQRRLNMFNLRSPGEQINLSSTAGICVRGCVHLRYKCQGSAEI